MNDDYQFRKDIDRLKQFVDEMDNEMKLSDAESIKDYLAQFYDQSVVDKFVADVTKLKSDLSILETSLTEFQEEVTSFGVDNNKFKEDLGELQALVNAVINDVTDLSIGSTEFSEALSAFDIDITEFVNTLMGLNNDLSVLSGYLDEFEGDLNDFEVELIDSIGEDAYNELSDDIVNLVWAIGNVRKRTETAEGNITQLRSDIGDDTNYDPSTYNPATGANAPQGLQQWSKWLKWKIGDSNSGMVKDINGLLSKIGNPNDTTSGTIYGDIYVANGHITDINFLINGDNEHEGILTQISNIQDDIDGITNANNTGSLDVLESMLNNITTRVDTILKTENGHETGRLVNLETQASTATTRLNALLNTSVTPNTGRIPDLETRTGSAEGRLDAIDGNNGRIAQLETRTTNAETRLTNLDGSNGRIKQLEDRTDSAEGRLDTLDGNNGRIAQLETRTTTAEGAISGIEGEIGNDGSNNNPKTGLYLLIDNVSSTLNNISTTVIGSDTTQTPSSSLWAMIRNIRDTKIGNDGSDGSAKTGIYALIDGLQSSISNAENVMGTTDNNDPLYNDNTTVWWKIRNLLGRIDDAEDNIGDVNIDLDDDLSNQSLNLRKALSSLLNVHFTEYNVVWIIEGDISQEEITEEDQAFVNSGLIKSYPYYLYWKYEAYGMLTKVTSPAVDEPVNTQLDNCVGLCYSLNHKAVITGNAPFAEPYSIIYEFKTNSFYVNVDGTWTPTTNVTNYFNYTALGNQISKWVENSSLTGNYHLFTNESLRICILYVDSVIVSGIPSNNAKDVKTFTATEMPHPPAYNVYSNSTSVANNVRLTSDRKLQALPGTGSSMAIATQFMWHY